jgi:hypothetical protein
VHHELHQLRPVEGFESSNDTLIEWLHDGCGVGGEENDGDVREAVHIEAHEDFLCGVRGDVCGGIVEKQKDMEQLSLHLGVDLHVMSPNDFALRPG